MLLNSPPLRWILPVAGVVALGLLWGSVAAADNGAALQVLDGQQPQDRRLEPLKDLDGYFPFEVPESRQAWQDRAEQVRRRMWVALGLWPQPTRTPLNAVVHGKQDHGDYTIEKVYFESMPGFFVAGNLYRPKSEGPHPGVLSAHGHWGNGRFYDQGLEQVKRQIVQGAERFVDGGRSPLQARCVQLARMGCVVFHFDMIGYADSTQLSYELTHRFAEQRPEANRPDGWGLFSPQAESHLQSVMGLQTWNSIRALDFLLELVDVDPQRIGVTGASGGGTQTFILCALDPRPHVSFPAVMVSTAMQGGCTCENACLLRIDTGNVEFAGLFAPKPQALTTADDWTREMDTKGFPELQQLYQMLDAPDQVTLHSLTQFGHNYNHVSRAAMYSWFNRHLQLGQEEPVLEEDYQRLEADQLTVWNDEHPRPEGGFEFEQQLLRWWTDDTAAQLQSHVPQDAESLRAFQKLVGGGIDILVGRSLPAADELAFEQRQVHERDQHVLITGLLNNTSHGEQVPVALLLPESWNRHAVIWVDEKGKAGLVDESGQWQPAVQKLLDAGTGVVAADLFKQGEFLEDGSPVTETRRVENPRESAAYTFGYNHSLFAKRVHDLLSVIAYCSTHDSDPDGVHLLATPGAGHWVAAARTQAPQAVTTAVVDTGGFRFQAIDRIHDPDFLPGGARYFDLPGMLALAAPGRFWIAGESAESLHVAQQAYRAAEAADHLVIDDGPAEDAWQRGVDWLLNQFEPES